MLDMHGLRTLMLSSWSFVVAFSASNIWSYNGIHEVYFFKLSCYSTNIISAGKSWFEFDSRTTWDSYYSSLERGKITATQNTW